MSHFPVPPTRQGLGIGENAQPPSPTGIVGPLGQRRSFAASIGLPVGTRFLVCVLLR